MDSPRIIPQRRTISRRHRPGVIVLNAVVDALDALEAARLRADRAMLDAANEGWTLREIADVAALSAATVNRAVIRAEQREEEG